MLGCHTPVTKNVNLLLVQSGIPRLQTGEDANVPLNALNRSCNTLLPQSGFERLQTDMSLMSRTGSPPNAVIDIPRDAKKSWTFESLPHWGSTPL